MKYYKTLWIVLILLVIIIGNAGSVNAQVTDGPIARQQLQDKVQDMLYVENFNGLEKMAHDFRKSKTKFTDGAWKLESYYYAFSAPQENSINGWKTLFAKLDKWQQQCPNSITAKVASGKAWIFYGWEARGTGYANTVNEDGWKQFKQRVKKAYSLISNAPAKSADDCPGRYELLLEIAKLEGWGRPNYEYLFQKAISYEPSYLKYYLKKAEYLLPQWYGEEGEWLQFAQEAMKLAPAEERKSVYTRIVAALWGVGFDNFNEPGISWPLMKQGYIEIDKNYPNSAWVLNKFCFFAYLANDKVTARELFRRIGNKSYLDAWQNNKQIFETVQKWAYSEN